VHLTCRSFHEMTGAYGVSQGQGLTGSGNITSAMSDFVLSCISKDAEQLSNVPSQR